MEQPAVTPDGRPIMLMGNVDLPEEIEAAVRHGAQGVGLLRTEFLLTGRATLPSEDEQTEYFRRVALAFPERTGRHPLVRPGRRQVPGGLQGARRRPIRSSAGGRSGSAWTSRRCSGRRSARILRAAADRDIQLMLPLVTLVEEVRETRAIVEEEAEALRAAGVRAAPSRCRSG